MNKQIFICSYIRTLASNKKEQTTGTSNNTDKCQKILYSGKNIRDKSEHFVSWLVTDSTGEYICWNDWTV